MANPGTADVWPQFQIDGPVASEGFEIALVGTDRRIRFSGPVAAGSVLVIDPATGTAVIDGSADRGGQLTYRDWFPVPAGGSIEVAFIPLGAATDAVLTGTVRPGWW
ncbi:phage distal tail protein [Cellulomonas denverensis]|uniref:phage distal tail protein n=1 Tax=Cellulomonas denverensis TaxID=264297 RepID=UPI0035EF107A